VGGKRLRNPDMHVFTYGSLMIPEVMRAVTGRDFRHEAAALAGYGRYRIRGESYPGIVPDGAAGVEGVVYRDVDPASIERLDRFEGDMYVRTAVTVVAPEGTRVPAETYVVRPEERARISDRPWSLAEFRARDLDRFMKGYAGFGWVAEKGARRDQCSR
jgi:gamma-glutamylcyclotransferase (GGCT)/AIG2-like uncharacterized protein YtfP